MSILDEINAAPDGQTSDRYHVELPDFFGPMDLLLSLIEREELEITKISLAHVTDQYLAYVTPMKEISPDNLTDFLVIASKLIFIKSKVLLPRPPASIIEDEVDDTDELVRQLRDYKRFKQLAQEMQTVEEKGQQSFVRLAAPLRIEPKLKPGEGSVIVLLTAVRRALTVKPEQPDVDTVVSRQQITIGDQVNVIRTRLIEKNEVPFKELLAGTNTRVEVIVTLLAVLELMKRRMIDISQSGNFGDITLKKLDDNAMIGEAWAEMTGMTELS